MDNITIIYGRLTRDPEYTEATGDKTQYVKFSVAVNRHTENKADFFDCVAFGKTADIIDKWCSKGSEVRVTGRMQCDPYEAKDGTKRYPWKLIVNRFGFCSGTNRKEEAIHPDFTDVSEEDIPF